MKLSKLLKILSVSSVVFILGCSMCLSANTLKMRPEQAMAAPATATENTYTYDEFIQFTDEVGKMNIVTKQFLKSIDQTELLQRIRKLAANAEEFTAADKERLNQYRPGPLELLDIKERVQSFQVTSRRLRKAANLNLARLALFEDKGLQYTTELEVWQRLIDSKQGKNLNGPVLLAIETTISSGLEAVQAKLQEVMMLNWELQAMDEDLYALAYHIDQLLKTDLLSGSQRTSPKMMSTDFIGQFDKHLWSDTASSVIVSGGLILQSMKDRSLNLN